MQYVIVLYNDLCLDEKTKILYLGHYWNTKDCSTVNTRRNFLENCFNQFNNESNITTNFSLINPNELNSLESSSIYENCSKRLKQLKIVSPAQEYFQ